MSDKIYGIDLGTTNSCLAVMESAGPRVIEIDGQPVVPSVVSFDRPKGEILVGQRARNLPEKRDAGNDTVTLVGGCSGEQNHGRHAVRC